VGLTNFDKKIDLENSSYDACFILAVTKIKNKNREKKKEKKQNISYLFLWLL
jgi:hypothetical protein